MRPMVGNDHSARPERLGLAVLYGSGSALIIFAVSTLVTYLVADKHDSAVWLTSALVITVISCVVSGPILSRMSARSTSAASRYL